MAKPRTPRHGDSSPGQSAKGGDGGGGDPPGRRNAAGGAGDPRSVSAAHAQVAESARSGRPGAGGTTSGSSAAPGVSPVRGPAAKTPLKPPNSRHNLNSIRPSNPAKEKNTIVLPGTDVGADLADISAGGGKWITDSNRYEINGRQYLVEPGGTVIPASGPGFVNLSRSQYKVLKQLIGSGGDVGAARGALARDPSISDADWRAAFEVFKHHKSYEGEP
ncbi:hypothetical protein [Actinoplanes sp. NPDC049316]|uniref:hypothetical protein n=1 Tax=Actinoplanes sp. NPDC049316 TaxID=3154727 RepID=UPI00342B1A55